MKKQIVIFLLTFMFSISLTFGQDAKQGSAPRGIDCLDGPLNPIAGKKYFYEAAATPAGGQFLFWATKDYSFISTTSGTTTTNVGTRLTTTTQLLQTSANYGTAAASEIVEITWSDATLNGTTAAAPTFVAVHYQAPSTGGCADNLKVWKIEPIKAFTVDIRNLNNDTFAALNYDIETEQCLDIVRGATWVTDKVEYDFGTQYLYFEVIAANFTNSWTPTFVLTGNHPSQTYTIEWTDTPPPFTGATWYPATTAVPTTASSTELGVSIYVRVTIANNNYEGIADRDITLAVDGQNSVGDWDIENNTLSDAGPLCNPTTGADQMDQATQVLKARPEETPVDPGTFAPGDNQN